MSTRSCIARREGDGWRGVYHHNDGYPTGLGCYIFRAIRRTWKGDIQAFLKHVIDDHDGGWSSLFSGTCYCHGAFARRDGTRPGIKPGDGKGVIAGCDCGQKPYVLGGDQGAEGPRCDPLSIEYVYILDPYARKMAVLGSQGEDLPGTVGYRLHHQDGRVEVEPQRAYRHHLWAVVDLDGPEPSWLAIECGEDLERCHHYRCLHGASGCKRDCPYCRGTGRANRPLLSEATWVDEHLPPVRGSVQFQP